MKGIVETIGGVVERLSISSVEKRRLERELTAVLLEHEALRTERRAEAVGEEARGNWLQRSWRPMVMLAFAAVIVVGSLTGLPLPEESSRFWDLLEIGLGGYIVGRFKTRK